jgi:2-polyprenyl-6-methoxyphenol hydroxylase-like FAD-dependent oxidoreductase
VATDRGFAEGDVSPEPIDVLVVGAGPVGLTLALQSSQHGAHVRLVERRPTAFRPSRAMILHPSTLDGLRRLGVTDALLARAATSAQIGVRLGTRELMVELDTLALANRPFPRPVLVRQSDVEAVVAAALTERGVVVERGTELIGVQQGPELVTAELRQSDARIEHVPCRYLAGCDGVHSTVRRLSDIECSGGSYRAEVVLADIELRQVAAPTLTRALVGPEGLVLVFPLGEYATWRLLATRPTERYAAPVGVSGPPVAMEELQQLLSGTGWPLIITAAPWSTSIRLPHQLADRFQVGRVLLAGDAAHAHSPAGGQGMNTGIQDALNLGWKLAFASRTDSAPSALLASYEQERRPVATQVLRLTRMLFWVEAGTGRLARVVRGRIAPLSAGLVPWVLRRRRLGAAAIWVLGQFWVHYRGSALTTGSRSKSAAARAGHRLPDHQVWCDGSLTGLHDLTAAPGLHILLARDAEAVPAVANGPWIRSHRIASWPGTGVAVVRPDGYVGLMGSADQVPAWLTRACCL